MTTIVGIQGDGFAVICADSRISVEHDGSYQIGTLGEGSGKLAQNGKYVIGAAGDVRAINILHHVFQPPTPPQNIVGKKLDQFFTSKFVPSLRECFDSQGYSVPDRDDKEHIAEQGSSIIVAINAQIYVFVQIEPAPRDRVNVQPLLHLRRQPVCHLTHHRRLVDHCLHRLVPLLRLLFVHKHAIPAILDAIGIHADVAGDDCLVHPCGFRHLQLRLQPVEFIVAQRRKGNINEVVATNVAVNVRRLYASVVIVFPSNFSWTAVGVALLLYWVTGGLGVTLGFHRLITHRSFQSPKWLEYFLALCGTLACQGGPIEWVGTHRIHHLHSDTPEDPHDSNKGFWWSHIGWLIFHSPAHAQIPRFTKDIAEDRVYQFLQKYFIPIQLFLGLFLLMLGGWSFVVWGIFARIVWVYHCTWLVNSATHKFGYRTYPES